jgi:hypothetical protein
MTTSPASRLIPAFLLALLLTPVAHAQSDLEHRLPTITEKTIISEHLSPRACYEWSLPLFTDGYDYNDYVEVSSVSANWGGEEHPYAEAAVLVGEGRLCITGLVNGEKYKIRFLDGLPFKKGRRLHKTLNSSVFVDHRKASLDFTDDAFILPVRSTQAVTLKVLNTPDARVFAYRINPTMVQAYLQNNRFNNPVDRWDMESRLIKDAELLGTQNIHLELEQNREKRIELDLDTLIQRREAAAYILVAEREGGTERRWENRATQFLILTDLGLTTYRHNEGLDLFVRSFESGLSQKGVRVELMARNFDLLGSATTDSEGRVHFPLPLVNGSNARQPVALFAYRGKAGEPDHQFTFLQLTGHPLDMGDRDVAGAPHPGLLSAYLYLERGVYRPGESFNLTALVRNRKLVSPGALPLTLKLFRPDGVETDTRVITTDDLGALSYRRDIPTSARTGEWTARLYLDAEGKPLGSVKFLIEDYIPATIEVELEAEEKGPLSFDSASHFEIRGDYLYGAPAANLPTEAFMTASADHSPFKRWERFHFGEEDHDFVQRRQQIHSTPQTDSSGRAKITIGSDEPVPATPLYPVPLTFTLQAGIVEPNGRITRKRTRHLISTYSSWSGIRPLIDVDDGKIAFPDHEIARFEVVSVDKEGNPLPSRSLEYSLVEEEWDYHWYRPTRGRWAYEISRYDVARHEAGKIKTRSNGLATLALSGLGYGHYRIELRDPATGSTTNRRFRIGWWASDERRSAAPDNVQLALSKPSAAPGTPINLHIKPPFGGQAQLVIASDRILENRALAISEEGADITITPNAAWGGEVHLLVNVFRPGSQNPGPARAIGIARLAIEKGDLHGEIEIEAPEKVRSEGQVTVRIKTRKMSSRARVTLAAVDEGILGLTRFSPPDPSAHFLAKRRLGLRINDLYGHLLQRSEGEQLKMHFGGDAPSKEAPPAPPTSIVRPVSLFSGVVALDESGEADIPLDLPHFNGRLRLMAVAFDEERLASTSRPLVVRDPLVIHPSLPRFVAIDDIAEIGVRLHNVEASSGEYRLSWSSDGGLFIGSATQKVVLEEGDSATQRNFITGGMPGNTRLNLTITAPDGEVREFHWPLSIRETRTRRFRSRIVQLLPGRPTLVGDNLVNHLRPESIALTHRLARVPLLDVEWLLDELDLYPFGCLEQTTSRAFPLLYLDRFGPLSEELKEKNKIRVQRAIRRIESMQTGSGAFTLWPRGHQKQRWLSAYATHFLMEARAEGYEVDDNTLKRAHVWIGSALLHAAWLELRGYALYLQAKAGRVDAGTLRYTLDQARRDMAEDGDKGHYRFLFGQLGAAFRMIGDAEHSREAFSLAQKARSTTLWQRINYASDLQETAALATFMLEGSPDPEIEGLAFQLAAKVVRTALKREYLNTQEKGWLVLMSRHLQGRADEALASQLTLYDTPLTPESLNEALNSLVAGRKMIVTNQSEKPLYLALTASGVEDRPQLRTDNGLSITKSILNVTTGQTTTLVTAKQGDLFEVTLHLPINGRRDRELSLIDPLPAGFEIENGRLGGLDIPESAKDNRLSTTRATFVELRDDRFMAAYTLERGGYSKIIRNQLGITARYLMRAVTPGHFRLPAVHVEDMYQPKINGSSAERRVKVVRRE